MTASPIAALRKAMRDALLADAALLAALGGAHVHDVAPRRAAAPWIAFGETRLRDWSSASGRGVEIVAQIDVWSTEPGSKQALTIAERVAALLDDADLTLADWRLVRLTHSATDARRENDSRFARCALRFRALLEQL
jgi:hypothetical protein